MHHSSAIFSFWYWRVAVSSTYAEFLSEALQDEYPTRAYYCV